MSFNSSNLHVVAYANGFTIWHYQSEDSDKNQFSDNYFQKAGNIMKEGDLIIYKSNKNRQTSLLVAYKNSKEEITVTPMTNTAKKAEN